MVRDHRELRVYIRAFDLAQDIFRASRSWPKEERYALTDQVRRSSRSVCANIAEAWRKRRYPKHFVSKLSDADAEMAETLTWLDFALDCGYVSAEWHKAQAERCDYSMGGLVKMMAEPDVWCGPSALLREPDTPYDASLETEL